MLLNKRREKFMVTLFRLIRSVIMGFIMGVGMTLAVICVTLFRIIKNLLESKTGNIKKIHISPDEK